MTLIGQIKDKWGRGHYRLTHLTSSFKIVVKKDIRRETAKRQSLLADIKGQKNVESHDRPYSEGTLYIEKADCYRKYILFLCIGN